MLSPALARRVVRTLVCRPHLWATALRQWRTWRVPQWWRRWPPVPGPSPEYLAFRLEAMYGTGGDTPEAEDLVGYLEWCRRTRTLAR